MSIKNLHNKISSRNITGSSQADVTEKLTNKQDTENPEPQNKSDSTKKSQF